MLRQGAWCAGLGAFILLTSACTWMAYRIARMSRLRARVDGWIDLRPPEEYYYDDTTTRWPVTSHEVTHETTPGNIIDRSTTAPTIGVSHEITPKVTIDDLTTSSTVAILHEISIQDTIDYLITSTVAIPSEITIDDIVDDLTTSATDSIPFEIAVEDIIDDSTTSATIQHTKTFRESLPMKIAGAPKHMERVTKSKTSIPFVSKLMVPPTAPYRPPGTLTLS